jgi:oligoribonuclease NrnB/cAMP/cGMP phosphodiesterase (DHH superfamily)
MRTCFYHAGCPDGFGAAWAVRAAWGNAGRFVARGHEDMLDAERYRGDEVVFVDIAPRNHLLCELAEEVDRIVVIDHHVTARDHYQGDPSVENRIEDCDHDIHYDLSQSGAVLAWRYYHPDKEVPTLLRYVQDQDLWNWALPDSAAVNAAIGSYSRSFEVWDMLAERSAAELAQEGAPILRAQQVEIQRQSSLAHPLTVDGRRVEAVNTPNQRSHIGHRLAQREKFGHAIGVVYRMLGSRVDASIYSIGDVDVSEVAQTYGGGGHKNAAGFSVSLKEWLADFL